MARRNTKLENLRDCIRQRTKNIDTLMAGIRSCLADEFADGLLDLVAVETGELRRACVDQDSNRTTT